MLSSVLLAAVVSPLVAEGATFAAPAVRPLAADSVTYDVLNHGRSAGAMHVMRAGDSLRVHYRHIDRNRGSRYEAHYRLAADGTPVAGSVRSVGLYDGVPAAISDRFEVGRDSVRWSGAAGAGGSAPAGAGYYRLRGAGPVEQALLVRYLLTRPDRSTTVLPAGDARVEIAADTVVPTAAGPARVRLALLHRATGYTSNAVWIDEHGELFASEVGWFITVRRGADVALPTLRAIELDYRTARGRALADQLRPAPVPAVAITHGNVFDAERGVLMPNTTVVVQGTRITAVGADGSVAIPAGAQVIDAAGKTVVPGLWEMHSHLQHTTSTGSGVQQLARGITTSRDLAADTDVAVRYRDQVAQGAFLGPRAILGGIIEGPGAWAGPSDVLVRTEDEARAAVAHYDSLGYRQIKLYNLVHPDLVPTIAAEAKARGLRLSGHVPRGIGTDVAVRLGFDEINHSAFLFSTFYPDSLYTPAMRPYSGVAQVVAPRIDVDSPAMTALIELFRASGTVIDGTFTLWYQGFATPAQGRSAATATDSANANWLRLVKRLHDGGVTMVPGTDAQGSGPFVNELEVYVRAGIPTSAVLQMATITSARVMGDEADYGSIAVGKVADLVIVDGNPVERIGALRDVHRVVLAGQVYDPAELRRALGMR